MPTSDSEVQAQAQNILDAIAFTPFEQCQPLNFELSSIPARSGIYAIWHKTDGLLISVKPRAFDASVVGAKLFCERG